MWRGGRLRYRRTNRQSLWVYGSMLARPGCSWHAPIRGQGQQNVSWPLRGEEGGRKGHPSMTFTRILGFLSPFLPPLSASFMYCLSTNLVFLPFALFCGRHTLYRGPRRRLSVRFVPWARLSLASRDLCRFPQDLLSSPLLSTNCLRFR